MNLYFSLLLRYSKPGEIVHKDGRVLGEHSGLANYTEGQRKGIQIAFSEPLYVVEKDSRNNRLIVGEKEYLGRDEFNRPGC